MTTTFRFLPGILACLATLLAGCAKRSPSATAAVAAAAPTQVRQAEALMDKAWPLAVMDIRVGRTLRVVRFQLHPESAPRTVANFIEKANAGFYSGLVFHRTIRNYLVQTGDPLSADNEKRDEWGTGGNANALRPETSRKNVRGSVTMARLDDKVNPGKLSHETQFFFCLRDLPTLDGKYSSFGTVLSGMDVLDLIGDSIVDTNDTPLERIEIKSIRVVYTRRSPGMVTALGVDDLETDDMSVIVEQPGAADTSEAKPESGLKKFFNSLW